MAKKPTNNQAMTDKKREEGKDLGGRPRFAIDYEKLTTMCAIMCTGEECAKVLGCSYQVLNLRLQEDYAEAVEELGENEDALEPDDRYNGFKECFKKNSAMGQASLRREQFRMALGDKDLKIKPDKTMLIWLGKNYLKQSDRIDHTSLGEKLPGPPEKTVDYSKLNEDEFKQLGQLLDKARQINGKDDEPDNSNVH